MAFIDRYLKFDLVVEEPWNKRTTEAITQECKRMYEHRFFQVGMIHEIIKIISWTSLESYLDLDKNKGRTTVECQVKMFMVYPGDILPVVAVQTTNGITKVAYPEIPYLQIIISGESPEPPRKKFFVEVNKIESNFLSPHIKMKASHYKDIKPVQISLYKPSEELINKLIDIQKSTTVQSKITLPNEEEKLKGLPNISEIKSYIQKINIPFLLNLWFKHDGTIVFNLLENQDVRAVFNSNNIVVDNLSHFRDCLLQTLINFGH